MLAQVLFIPLPANITGLFFLLILLLIKAVSVEEMEGITNLLTNNITIMFVPAGASLITTYKIIANDIGAFLFICIVSTILTFLATAGTINLVILIQNKLKAKFSKAGVS